MIKDSLANADKYLSLGPNFAKAFAFLKNTDLSTLTLGRHEIDGENCYANVMECELKPVAEEMTYEAHRRYYDIQVPITGPEVMGVMAFPAEAGAYDEKGDCYLFPGKGETITVNRGEFIVFNPPADAHAPCKVYDAPRKIKKVVVKVLAVVV